MDNTKLKQGISLCCHFSANRGSWWGISGTWNQNWNWEMVYKKIGKTMLVRRHHLGWMIIPPVSVKMGPSVFEWNRWMALLMFVITRESMSISILHHRMPSSSLFLTTTTLFFIPLTSLLKIFNGLGVITTFHSACSGSFDHFYLGCIGRRGIRCGFSRLAKIDASSEVSLTTSANSFGSLAGISVQCSHLVWAHLLALLHGWFLALSPSQFCWLYWL